MAVDDVDLSDSPKPEKKVSELPICTRMRGPPPVHRMLYARLAFTVVSVVVTLIGLYSMLHPVAW